MTTVHDITETQLAYATQVVPVEPGWVEVFSVNDRHGLLYPPLNRRAAAGVTAGSQ
jgi:hypothetical protein